LTCDWIVVVDATDRPWSLTLGGFIANISAKLYYGWPSPHPPGGDVSHDHHHHDSIINARGEEAPVVADTVAALRAGGRGDDENDNSSMWCLRHQSKELTVERLATGHHQKIQLQLLNQPLAPKCGRLRRRHTLWLEGYELRSDVAQSIRARQQCDRSSHHHGSTNNVATFTLDNDYGLGSHLYQWSQAFCTADEMGYRLQTYNPQWLWRDQEYCNGNGVRFNQSESPFACYFPGMENQRCADKVLPEKDPNDLITDHIRYGDKFWEMDLVPIDDYVQAVHELLQRRRESGIYDKNDHLKIRTVRGIFTSPRKVRARTKNS
jgi:hypothetical protein